MLRSQPFRSFHSMAKRVCDRMFDSPTHSDLSIVVDSYTFKAHKVILGMRTQFFTNATNPQSGFSEAKDGVVTIKEHGIPAVWCFLKYCYTGNYSSGPNIIGLGNGSFIAPTPSRAPGPVMRGVIADQTRRNRRIVFASPTCLCPRRYARYP